MNGTRQRSEMSELNSRSCCVAIGLAMLLAMGSFGCAPKAVRGGEGTANPEIFNLF